METAPEYSTECTNTDAKFSKESPNSSTSYSVNNLEELTAQLVNVEAIATTSDHFDEEYYMIHKYRGFAIIFNHEHFSIRDVPSRLGTNKDCDDLTFCLNNLGFNVVICKDYLHKQIEEKIKWAVRQDHTNNDCILIVIMSHGNNGGNIYAKDKRYKADEIFQAFTGDKCPTLAGKPKIFIIQACRGIQIEDKLKMECEGTQKDGISSMDYKIPLHADFLMAYSTIPGFYSWRSESDGSWFIQSLCNELTKNGKNYDILTLLTFVSQRVAIDYESYHHEKGYNKKKQIPCIVSMLTRLLYFHDKH